ncbi:LysE family translocator [Endozoicomonas atrinae]|uniref:LysE family translocator n=1 Tax=Endozoicomonas atrinae TaxID=1333660 RepID=UPI003B009946
MTASSWLSLLAICVLGAISPGPSLAAVMKSTVQGSRAHGLVTSISHALGIGIYAFLVAAGIGVVITETPWLYKFITYAGAAYLAWMGYKAITSSSSLVKESHQLQQSYSQIWCLNTFQATSLSASVPALTPSLKQIPCTTSASSLKPLNLRQPF